MLNGTTYIVRPRIDPSNSSFSVARISAGSAQLLVGPASDSRSEQMKVRSSTRATSLGSDSARYEFGRLESDSRRIVPASISVWHRRSYSSREPSHQYTSSGRVSLTIPSTQAWRRVCGFSPAAPVPCATCIGAPLAAFRCDVGLTAKPAPRGRGSDPMPPFLSHRVPGLHSRGVNTSWGTGTETFRQSAPIDYRIGRFVDLEPSHLGATEVRNPRDFGKPRAIRAPSP